MERVVWMAAPAKSLEIFCSLFDKIERKVVLDYGSGNLRNSLYLQQRGYEVYAVDLPRQLAVNRSPCLNFMLPEELPNHQIEAGLALCTFVLNLIPETMRISVLANIAQNMSPGGYFLLETAGLSLVQLDQLVVPRGFFRIHHHLGRYTVVVLYKFLAAAPKKSLQISDSVLT